MISLRSRRFLLVLPLLLAGRSAPAAEWRPAPAPLLTRWAADVSPTRARPDYPRPNAVRKEWQNLNGLWQFAFDDAAAGRASGWLSGHDLPQQILVPWTFEAALSGIGKGGEIHEHVWYRRAFIVPHSWRNKQVLLHFGAVDWESTVWVNGKEMGTHRGGYAPFTYDITAALKPNGPQELVVAVTDPADPKKGAYQPKGKQLGSEGIWYTRTTGIWQTVWLEPVNRAHIDHFTLEPKIDAHGTMIDLKANIKGVGDLRFSAEVFEGGKSVGWASLTGSGDSALESFIAVPEPKLWTPETPTLYTVKLELMHGSRVTDEINTYCALRTVGIAKDRITLNGKPYFLKGVLDQGFWPDGVYTPPTDDAIQNDVRMAKAFGFNLARKHVKVEDPRWYYWCDKLGLLVAQDMPSSHNLSTPEAKENFVREWKEIMDSVRAHPCVILWITFNENWGDPGAFQDQVVDLTRAADPSRPIIDASGWKQRDKTDITDIHDYGNDLRKHVLIDPPRARWIGEYGGIALPVEGHTWVKGWGYQTVHTPAELVDKYRSLTNQIDGAGGLSGFVYTQLTDVEQELNGLMTYDRLPKAAPRLIAAVNAGDDPGYIHAGRAAAVDFVGAWQEALHNHEGIFRGMDTSHQEPDVQVDVWVGYGRYWPWWR